MNYTKEDMENFASYAIKHEDLFYHTDLLKMWDKENRTASRDSRILSAVPSEEWKQIFREIWDIGNELAGADNPEDFFEIEFEKWKTNRGIVG